MFFKCSIVLPACFSLLKFDRKGMLVYLCIRHKNSESPKLVEIKISFFFFTSFFTKQA